MPLLLAAACAQTVAGQGFQPTWESLASRPTQQWLADAKFGIYAHWGVYSVPAFGNEWYARRMYDPQDPRGVYEHHRKTYGTQDKFGYKDLVPMFKAEKFDPNEWAELIRQSGARYAGTAVVHHDGFLLWDSKVSRWNAAQMGPRRDLYGDLVKALRAKGIKILATEHHMRTYNWYLPPDKSAWEEQRKAKFDLYDPRYADLYWNEFTGTRADFMKAWRAKLLEVIDNYRPDVLWFDGGDFTSPEVSKFVLETLAHYHNQGRGVEVLNKFAGTMKFNFPREYGMLTYEAGRDRPERVDRPWIDDLSIGIGSWGYIQGLKVISPAETVLGLADRVSRGGGLLLSLAPTASGEIPADQKAVLREIGDWLKVNGEAIYGARPWKIHAEGPVEKLIVKRGAHTGWRFDNCNAQDIRFTRKGSALYAIALGWPEDGRIVVKSLKSGVASVSLLGARNPVQWSQTAEGLSVEMPARKPCRHAYTLKIAMRGALD
ncbi:MAG: alpha-L-fucosidase [Acidobacteria bacterium]|nr:alpha-L-fucosidase [Acidobacteriota bacterium]